MSRSGVQISVQDLTHRYSSRGPVTFDQVNLESKPGEVLAIIGRSGCGKSTLLHIMAGLLAPTSGSIRLNNIEVKEPSPKWVMMFQAPHLFPWMQVSQNVGIGLKFANFAEDKIRERVEKTIKLVDLEEFAESNVQDLSGGQQQRVFLARAFVQQASIYLLDEPFAGVDAATEKMIVDILHGLRDAGKTVSLVHHDLTTVNRYFDHVILLNKQLIASGPTETTFTSEHIQATYGVTSMQIHDVSKDAIDV